MPTLRDNLLPVVAGLRALPQAFGLRRYTVTIRRIVWSGQYPGDGSPADQDIVITPIPRVRNAAPKTGSLKPESMQFLLANGNIIDDRFYQIDRITPAFVDASGNPGGYTPQQLRTQASPDVKNIEELVILVGDDGVRRDCVQVSLEIDRAFGYSMMVHETDRPRMSLSSISVAPAAVSVGATVQLKAQGVFQDSNPSDLTPLVTWTTSDATVCTVDLLGVATGVGAGTATVTATLTNVTSSATVTVS